MLCSGSNVFAQYYKISKVKSENEFRQKVNSIIQDKEGFIWLGTENGLFRFDGSQYLQFNKGAHVSALKKLIEDKHGTIWLATDKGIYGVSSKRDSIIHYTTDIDDGRSLMEYIVDLKDLLKHYKNGKIAEKGN